MKKIFVLICIGLFLCGMVFAAKNKQPDYFPLRVGNVWKYDFTAAKDKMVIKVTGIEKVDKKDCYKVETLINGEPVLAEYMYKSGNDIFENKIIMKSSNKISMMILKPSKKIITNPLKPGDCWTYNGKDIGCQNSMQTKKAVKEEFVRTPAGRFKAMRVMTTILEKGKKIDKIAWYVAGIGPVKSVGNNGCGLVLTEYKIVE